MNGFLDEDKTSGQEERVRMVGIDARIPTEDSTRPSTIIISDQDSKAGEGGIGWWG